MVFKAKDRTTAVLDIILLLLALGVIASSCAAGIVIPANLAMGTVAPVNSSNVFLTFQTPNPEQIIQLNTLYSTTSQRAVAAVDSEKETLSKRVIIELGSVTMNGSNSKVETLTYKYNLTGVELALQHASKLLHSVEGACTIEYRWLNTTSPNWDVYKCPFLKSDRNFHINREPILKEASQVYTFMEEPLYLGDKERLRYAVFFDTVGRQSYTAGKDPMYSTAFIPITATIRGAALLHVVMRGRPALSCWQQDSWTYNGETTTDIHNITGIIPKQDVPTVLQSHLIYHLSSPRVVNLMQSFGGSVLAGSSVSTSGMFDAASSSWVQDMTRMVLASYVSTRDIFRDTTRINNRYGLKNSAMHNQTGEVEPGAGDFVISGKVITLSLKVLISIPSVWLAVCIIIAVIRCSRYTNRNSGWASRFTLRAVGLQAPQMYRLLDEEICGDRDDWVGRKGHMPYIILAKEPKSEHPEYLTNLQKGKSPEGTPSEHEDITDHTTIDPPRYPRLRHSLFSAPKVLKGDDGRYHLKFTGVMEHELKEAKSLWAWKDGRLESVADGPMVGKSTNNKDEEQHSLIPKSGISG